MPFKASHFNLASNHLRVSLICATHLIFEIKINAAHYRPDVEEMFVSVVSVLVQIRFVIFSFRESAMGVTKIMLVR